MPQFETMIDANDAMNEDAYIVRNKTNLDLDFLNFEKLPQVYPFLIQDLSPEYKNPCQFGFSGYDPMLCALVTGSHQ